MGLGPAVFGVLFYMFHVDLGSKSAVSIQVNSTQIEDLLPPALQVSHEFLYKALSCDVM